jgi:hypothetical protein
MNLADSSTVLAGIPGVPFSGGLGTFAGMPVLPGQTTTTRDDFLFHNQFRGAQLGLRLEYEYSNFSVQLTGKMGLGVVHEVQNVSGSSTLLGAGPAVTLPGGILVPNGSHRAVHDQFAVLPEADLRLGYELNGCISFQVGYSFLWLNRAVRPSDGLLPVNTAGSPTSPQFATNTAGGSVPFTERGFFAHGVSFGIAYRY